MKRIGIWVLFVLAMVVLSGQGVRAGEPMKLSQVRTFMYQLQNLEDVKRLEALAGSEYDLVVVEPTGTVRDQAGFDVKGMVAKLHAGKAGRVVLAYLNAGQAESYRTYWKKEWKAPTKGAKGEPGFLLMADPDGWVDNYNVAYWDKGWQEVFATGKESEVRRAMAAGFDGVYLDWIDGYRDEKVVAEAKKQGVEPAKAMVDFLLLIRKTAREVNPRAVVVQQNAYDLLEEDGRLLEAIDGLGVEDTWFGGKANAKWGTKGAGDRANKAKDGDGTEGRLKVYEKYKAAGKVVLTVDYCVKRENAARVYGEARRRGLVPLVTQVTLDRLTETPPP